MYVEGDDYLTERRDDIQRELKTEYQIQRWLLFVVGAAAVAYGTWGSRWWLVVLILTLGFTILRAFEIVRKEQAFILGSLENRARIVEGRTEGISAMVERIDKANNRAQNFSGGGG